MNFNNTLIHASSLGKLFTEPVKKEDKEAGNLSATAKTHLIEVYISQKYGRKKDIETRQMSKGKLAEDDSLLLLSEHLGEYLEKNEGMISNNYIVGTPDAFIGLSLEEAEIIYDVKSSYDIFTFLANIEGNLNKDYYYQLQAYMWLTGAKEGFVSYCLVDLPTEQLEVEKSYVMRKTGAISEESQDFKDAWKKKESLFLYNDIDESERILLFKVEKDETFPEKCQQKVEKARIFLQDLQNKHLNFNIL
jgi:hypothetical protein